MATDRDTNRHICPIFQSTPMKEDVLISVSHGLDLFLTSYPTILTNKGQALTFAFPVSAETQPPPRWIHLLDEKYARDFTPISMVCSCMACKNGNGFSKAYLRHLLIAGEMLAEIGRAHV